MEGSVLLLANYAERTEAGLISAIGLGWSVTGSPTSQSALVLMLKVPWDQTNIRHRAAVTLNTADGRRVRLPDGSDGPQVEFEFETGRPPGVEHGVPLEVTQAFNVSSLPLAPGRYSWDLVVDAHPVTQRTFTVRGATP